jgi:hypothetical protein
MKKLLFSVFLALVVLASNAQERPMRIGFKFGIPQIAGLNLEYVTPLLNGRLAGDLDLTYLPFGVVSYSNIGIGANYYFFDEGQGLYGGIGYSRWNFGGDWDIEDSNGIAGKGTAGIGENRLNLKLGGKHGGLFYFRWELGYGMALTSPDLKVTGTINGVSVTETIDLPLSIPGFTGNIGFGFSF